MAKRLSLLVTGAADILVYDLERETATKLPMPLRNNFWPVWAPDGKHIAYRTQQETSYSFMWIRADGSGEPQRLWESKTHLGSLAFSPDGRRLAFSDQTGDNRGDIWTLPLDTSDPDHPKPGKPEVFLHTTALNRSPEFSPDGHWLAYVSNESGISEVYVRPFTAGLVSNGGRTQISTGGGNYPVWSRAARQILYESRNGYAMVADYSVDGDSFRLGKARPWADRQFLLASHAGANFDVAPDGKRLVVLANPEPTDNPKGNVRVTVLVNWFDELRRRMPSGGK